MKKKPCKNCNIFIDQYSYLIDDPYCGAECMFEHKIKIKKEDLPKRRSGVQPTNVMKNKKKYKRKDRYGRKYE